MAILQEAMPLRFHVANRAAAERAGALLHSRTGCEARLGVTENDHVVTVPRVEASRREAVRQ